MAQTIIPPDVKPEAPITWTLVDDKTVTFQPAMSRLGQQVATYGDPAWSARMRFRGLRQADRARIMSALLDARGGYGVVRVCPYEPPRGSFPASELFANADFSNGATGWGSQNATLSVSDRVMRLTANKASGAAPAITQTLTVTQYAPHLLRGFAGPRNRSGLTIGTYAGGSNYSTDAQGLISQSVFPLTTSSGALYPIVYDGSGNVTITGDWIECPFASFSRCALVDNSPNALTYSDQFDNAAWSKNGATISANADTAPDSTSTADRLVESSGGSLHFINRAVTKAASAQDWCGFVYAKANTRSQIRIVIGDNASNYGSVYVDLSTGTVLSGPSASGAVTNARAFIVDKGNGWYLCCLVANIPASITASNYMVVYLASGGGVSYSGDGSSNVRIWRGGYAQSSVPVRPAQTTSTAVASGTTQTGSLINIKGLPVSTDGLLMAGDWCEINGELKQLTAPLNSDAAGLGQLSIRPGLVNAAADNDPVIIRNPMGRFVVRAPNGMDALYGQYGEVELELMEVYRD